VHRNCNRNTRERFRGAIGRDSGRGKKERDRKGVRGVVPSPADVPAVLVTAFWQKSAIVYVQFVTCRLSRDRVIVIVRGERGKM